jgi:ubiquinone/menaquinone biosynthesis C-methylase UbiE
MNSETLKWSDQEYLLNDQYKDASNLGARQSLHDRFSTNKYGLHRWIFDLFHLAPNSRILELGCGPGTLWLHNLHRIPDGWDVTLSDFSPGMLQKALQNLGNSGHPFKFQVVDAQAIPFENENFDAVIANHMLYHVPDRAKALSEIRRILRPGGRFYASTIGRAHLRELYDLMEQFDSHLSPWGKRPSEVFLLENGQEQIAQWFSKVDRHRYQDALVITEAEPLVAYVLSGIASSMYVGDKRKEFASFVEQELAWRGVIHVTKDSGLFEAW